MKVSVLCTLLLWICGVSASAQDSNLKNLVGTWEYSMENPMDGSTIDASCTVEAKDGKTTVSFDIMGNVVSTTPLTLKDGKYVAELENAGFPLSIAVELKSKDAATLQFFFEGEGMPAVDMKRAKAKK